MPRLRFANITLKSLLSSTSMLRRLPGRIGVLIGTVLAIVVIGMVNNTPFLSIEGLAIVIGGSIANALLSYSAQDVRQAFTAIRALLDRKRDRRHGLHRDIMRIIMWSYVVQSQDFIGLEKESARITTEPLQRYGLDLVVSGYEPEKIREMMETITEAEFERRCAPVTVLRNMAATAPAFGMVGTLIGMVMIMHNAGADLAHIESGLAVAMLSTLYGLLVARLLCLPAADKLLRHEESEHFRNYVIIEGLTLLAEKHKPSYVQDRLNSFLSPSKHLRMNSYVQAVFNRQMGLAA